MIPEILSAVKMLISGSSPLNGYIASGSCYVDIAGNELQDDINSEINPLTLQVYIKPLDMTRIGSFESAYNCNDYVLSGKIDIKENVGINRTQQYYLNGYQARDYVAASITNKLLPAISGSNFKTENLSKITVVSAKMDDVNTRDNKKSEYVKHVIDYRIDGLIQSV